MRALICKDHCLLFDAHRPRSASVLFIKINLIAILDSISQDISSIRLNLTCGVGEINCVGKDPSSYQELMEPQ